MVFRSFRFVILRHVPRELLHKLPIPSQISRNYLDTPFYYSEDIATETAREEGLLHVEESNTDQQDDA